MRSAYNRWLCVCVEYSSERISKTVQIEKKYMEIEEKGVKLRLTIVDTPGFNDSVNSNEWSVIMMAAFFVVHRTLLD